MRVLSILMLAAGCIEGPEPDSIHNITPRGCETGIAPDQTFVIDGRFELARQDALRTDPPKFAFETAAGTIDVAISVGELGQLSLQPVQPLPADDDVQLRLVDPGALDGAHIPPGMFPAAFSTRNMPVIRSFRATSGISFVSFSQPLDATTVDDSVYVYRGTAPVTAPAMYLEAPGHVVYVETYNSGPIEIEFQPTLRTKSGTAVFEVAHRIQIDPEYTPPAANGCEHAE